MAVVSVVMSNRAEHRLLADLLVQKLMKDLQLASLSSEEGTRSDDKCLTPTKASEMRFMNSLVSSVFMSSCK